MVMHCLLVMFYMLSEIRSEIQIILIQILLIMMYILQNKDSEFDLLRENVTGDKKRNNLESDVSGLINLREEFPNNPMIGYLNINSLGNKINFLNAQLI